MRILIIDDDKDLVEVLKLSFESESFVVDTAFDGEEGSYVARTNEYDAIIVDYALPKKDGKKVCQEIREARKKSPILFLTVLTDIASKVDVFDSGADDYVTKPFSFEELSARVKALMRRPQLLEESVFSVSNVILDVHKQKVLVSGIETYLTRKEFSLLEFLLRNRPNVMSRGMIMEHVWNYDSDPFSNTIESHILNLRKKIEKDGSRLIYNVPGRGYKIDIKK